VVVHDDKPVGLDVRIAVPRGLRESLTAVD
jgi:hypothetical protein